MALREAGEDVAEVGERIDAVELRRLDQRRQTRPMLRPAVTGGDQAEIWASSSLTDFLPGWFARRLHLKIGRRKLLHG